MELLASSAAVRLNEAALYWEASEAGQLPLGGTRPQLGGGGGLGGCGGGLLGGTDLDLGLVELLGQLLAGLGQLVQLGVDLRGGRGSVRVRNRLGGQRGRQGGGDNDQSD